MAKADPGLELLGKVPLFSGLTRKELTLVHSLAKPFHFAAGSAVVSEGDTASRFFLVTDGYARVLVGGRVRRVCGPGDYFGELALIDEGPRTATVVAETELQTLGIAAFNFRPLLRSEPTITYKLLVEMARWLRDSDAALVR